MSISVDSLVEEALEAYKSRESVVFDDATEENKVSYRQCYAVEIKTK